MSQSSTLPAGLSGMSETYNTVRLSGVIDASQPYTNLEFADGKVVCLPTHLLAPNTPSH